MCLSYVNGPKMPIWWKSTWCKNNICNHFAKEPNYVFKDGSCCSKTIKMQLPLAQCCVPWDVSQSVLEPIKYPVKRVNLEKDWPIDHSWKYYKYFNILPSKPEAVLGTTCWINQLNNEAIKQHNEHPQSFPLRLLKSHFMIYCSRAGASLTVWHRLKSRQV